MASWEPERWWLTAKSRAGGAKLASQRCKCFSASGERHLTSVRPTLYRLQDAVPSRLQQALLIKRLITIFYGTLAANAGSDAGDDEWSTSERFRHNLQGPEDADDGDDGQWLGQFQCVSLLAAIPIVLDRPPRPSQASLSLSLALSISHLHASLQRAFQLPTKQGEREQREKSALSGRRKLCPTSRCLLHLAQLICPV